MHTPLFPTPTRPDPGPARIHIDTETLSIEPDAAIISIGAVLFMPGRTDPSGHFSCNIDFADALRHGRADGNTIAWWFKQPEATRLATLDNPVSLENALTQLNDWIDAATARIEPGDPIEYMANGPAFDFVALRNAYQRVLGKPTPWKYWAERDYRTERDQLKRTLAHLGLDTSEPERIDAHNALSDAMHQGTVIATLDNRLFTGLDQLIALPHLKPQPSPAQSKKIGYSYCVDGETCRGNFPSPEAAAADAFARHDGIDQVAVYENIAEPARFYASADSILHDTAQRAEDYCGEVADDWLDHLINNEEKEAELEQLVGDWLNTNAPVSFWRVEAANERTITRAELEHAPNSTATGPEAPAMSLSDLIANRPSTRN